MVILTGSVVKNKYQHNLKTCELVKFTTMNYKFILTVSSFNKVCKQTFSTGFFYASKNFFNVLIRE